jgi:hypothetical protein
MDYQMQDDHVVLVSAASYWSWGFYDKSDATGSSAAKASPGWVNATGKTRPINNWPGINLQKSSLRHTSRLLAMSTVIGYISPVVKVFRNELSKQFDKLLKPDCQVIFVFCHGRSTRHTR